jgi:hypothetical protein
MVGLRVGLNVGNFVTYFCLRAKRNGAQVRKRRSHAKKSIYLIELAGEMVGLRVGLNAGFKLGFSDGETVGTTEGCFEGTITYFCLRIVSELRMTSIISN